MAAKNDGPIKIRDVPSEELVEIHEHIDGPKVNSARFGDVGYFLPDVYRDYCHKIYNMEVRPDDIFVVTYPRSGTTWTQELVWLLANNLDYETAANAPMGNRFPFIEFTSIMSSKSVVDWLKTIAEYNPMTKKLYDQIKNLSHTDSNFDLPSPRLMKSHLPLSLLPPSLLDTAKVVYVARDPRDVAVSFYHHQKSIKFYGFKSEFKHFWNLFIKHKIDWTPFGPHIIEAWEKRHHPNMLFLFYEDLAKDLPTTARRVAQFLNKPVTEEQLLRLCDHLHIDNFKRNKSVNGEFFKEMDMARLDGQFIRKGKVGGWQDYFDDEMKEQAQRLIKETFKGTGIEFRYS